jgi:hypothetical protein
MPSVRLHPSYAQSRRASQHATVSGLVLVLDLKLPEGVKTGNDAEVWRQLLELQGRFTTYALSFIVLGT